MGKLNLELVKIKNFLIDLIFPKECINCGQPKTYLCSNCFKKIDINSQFYCVLCHKPTKFHDICWPCQEKTALKAVFVVANYNNQILQDLIHNLKYKYIEALSETLANLAIKYINHYNIFNNFNINQENTVITYVPLHKKRLLNRGFNQSELLANYLSDFYKIKKTPLLVRKVNTISQVNLKRTERANNIKDAFEIDSRSIIENKKVIIVDDVLTTGSTLNECAKTLANQGFKDIYGLVLAQRDD